MTADDIYCAALLSWRYKVLTQCLYSVVYADTNCGWNFSLFRKYWLRHWTQGWVHADSCKWKGMWHIQWISSHFCATQSCDMTVIWGSRRREKHLTQTKPLHLAGGLESDRSDHSTVQTPRPGRASPLTASNHRVWLVVKYTLRQNEKTPPPSQHHSNPHLHQTHRLLDSSESSPNTANPHTLSIWTKMTNYNVTNKKLLPVMI